jgi:hypothetical protein
MVDIINCLNACITQLTTLPNGTCQASDIAYALYLCGAAHITLHPDISPIDTHITRGKYYQNLQLLIID